MPEFEEAEIRKRIGDGSILGISIDTAVFHGYGYNLRHPVLAKLDQFKVGGVELLLSEVVAKSPIQKFMRHGSTLRDAVS